MNIYSVYDAKAKTFERPFILPNHPQAIRSFASEVNRKDERNANMLNEYPEDYSLHHVGTFNTEDGTITPAKNLIIEAKACIRNTANSQ